MTQTPAVRIREVNRQPLNESGRYVLYWMIASRRLHYNFALQRAVELSRRLGRPLLVLEALRCDYPFASDRLHRFILDGMEDNRKAFARTPARYYPYVERRLKEGKGLLAALGKSACAVVTDDFPTFFLPHMVEAAGRQLSVRLEAVDANGLFPMRATERAFPTAFAFRRHLARALDEHLQHPPKKNPFAGMKLEPLAALPREISRRWPPALEPLLAGDAKSLAALPIDHSVSPVPVRGGRAAGLERLRHFVRERLPSYEVSRADPALEGTSRLSPWLHFGHVAIQDVVEAVLAAENRRGPLRIQKKPRRKQLFGLSNAAEAWLDEAVTWRELGFNLCSKREDHARYESLPEWAKRTLDAHRKDPRPALQSDEALEQGETHDPLFNAAQRQLLEEGWFHNAVRMIWGKKLLEYSPSPEVALKRMSRLMNRYSLDGRGPNSISGFFWVLGRYDRPWGPERQIFGTVRYMTSTTPEKLRRYRAYIRKYAPEGRGVYLLPAED
jgi:deoxyribodipyrimidine photo-lyase